MGADVRQARDPRLGAANEGNRAFDVAHRPQYNRKVNRRPSARVPSKAERQIVVAPRLEQGQRAFQMILRFAVLSGEPSRFGAGYADLNRGILALPICSRKACETSTKPEPSSSTSTARAVRGMNLDER